MPRSSASSGASRPGADYLSKTNPGPCVRPCQSRTMAEEDATWRRLIRSPRSSGTIEPSRRCSATVLLPAASTSHPTPLSHLAVRVADWDLYVHQRTLLERHARANIENVWNGRPISKIVLAEPLDVLDGTPVSLIELIPPVHQRVYRMGLEHLGVVVGEDIDDFSRVHRAALTGQQFQSPDVEPYYVLFEDFNHVKFYRRSLYDGCSLGRVRFDGFSHVDDWVPQRLVTATGPNPLPR